MPSSFPNSSFNVPRTFPFLNIQGNHPEKSFRQKVDDLDTADDWESCEKSHRASDETQLCFHFHFLVPLDVVKGRSVKEDLNNLCAMRKLE